MTMGNKPIASGFAFITVSQFIVGIAATISRAKKGGKIKLPDKKDNPRSTRSIGTVPVQHNRSHRYLLMHTTCVCFSRIDPTISFLRESPSFTVRVGHSQVPWC